MMEWFGLSPTIRSSRRIETEWTPNVAELRGKSLAREVMQKEEFGLTGWLRTRSCC